MKHRILLVDDDPDTTQASAILLGLDGHECRRAASGVEAIHVAEEFTPDIVILDIGLPGMDGYALARELRVNAAGRPLHLAAVTGRAEASDVAQSRAAGVDQHLLKPIDGAALRAIVLAAERAGVLPPG